MDDALLLVSDGGVIVELNAPASALLEQPRIRLIGARLHEFAVPPTDGLDRFLTLCSRSKQFLPGSLTLMGAHSPITCRIDGAASAGTQDLARSLVLRVRSKREADAGFELLNRAQHIERLAREIEQRERVQVALHAERERFRVTLSSIGDGVIATDAEGLVTFMNEGAEQLTGWSQNEAAGKAIGTVFHIVNEVTRVPVSNPIDHALRDGVVVGLANHTVLINRHGKERAIDDSAAPIRSETGAILGAVLIFRDISEKRANERALLKAHEDLEVRVGERTAELTQANERLLHQHAKLATANAELEQFAYIAAHDLQEPIRMIVVYLQLVHKRVASTFDQQTLQYFTTAHTSARRMQDMVRSVLDFSTIGKEDSSTHNLPLASVVHDALQHLESVIERAGGAVDVAELPIVSGARAPLVRLFQNLIANAIKFRSEHPPRIRISAIQDSDRWKISVSDNGIGIRMEESSRLFQLFQRLHSPDQYPGIGIGLASCKKIVEQHGGTIWFESVPGQGTTFHFTLTAGTGSFI